MKNAMLLLIVIPCLMFSAGCCKPIIEKEYIQITIPDTSADPEFYSVKWGMLKCPFNEKEMCYYLDETNAKNLLKDWELKDAQVEDLKTILKGLRR
jgi:hypothetical protein